MSSVLHFESWKNTMCKKFQIWYFSKKELLDLYSFFFPLQIFTNLKLGPFKTWYPWFSEQVYQASFTPRKYIDLNPAIRTDKNSVDWGSNSPSVSHRYLNWLHISTNWSIGDSGYLVLFFFTSYICCCVIEEDSSHCIETLLLAWWGRIFSITANSFISSTEKSSVPQFEFAILTPSFEHIFLVILISIFKISFLKLLKVFINNIYQ